MSGIKSAIELAMERTKGLVLDEKEKNSLAVKDTENKIKAVLRRYREGMIDSDGVGRETARIEADEKLKKTILMDLLIDKLDFKGRNESLFELLYIISKGLKEPFKEEMETIRKDFLEDAKKKEGAVREKIKDHLKDMGISGSGIEPNIQAWDEWNESVEETGRVFREHMIAWNKRLKAADDI